MWWEFLWSVFLRAYLYFETAHVLQLLVGVLCVLLPGALASRLFGLTSAPRLFLCLRVCVCVYLCMCHTHFILLFMHKSLFRVTCGWACSHWHVQSGDNSVWSCSVFLVVPPSLCFDLCSFLQWKFLSLVFSLLIWRLKLHFSSFSGCLRNAYWNH